MGIRKLCKRGGSPAEQLAELNEKNKYVNWTYHTIPMTLELARRKDEEELIELYGARKFKRAVIINRGDRNV